MNSATALDPDMSLGAIVNAYPSLARQLERLDLDYCCSGERSLADACRANDIARCFSLIRADIEPHLTKEERVLFPAIQQLADASADATFGFGSIGNPVSMMLREHDDLGGLLRELRLSTDDYTPPADGCGSYSALFSGLEQVEADTHPHIHKENNVLFPQ